VKSLKVMLARKKLCTYSYSYYYLSFNKCYKYTYIHIFLLVAIYFNTPCSSWYVPCSSEVRKKAYPSMYELFSSTRKGFHQLQGGLGLGDCWVVIKQLTSTRSLAYVIQPKPLPLESPPPLCCARPSTATNSHSTNNKQQQPPLPQTKQPSSHHDPPRSQQSTTSTLSLAVHPTLICSFSSPSTAQWHPGRSHCLSPINYRWDTSTIGQSSSIILGKQKEKKETLQCFW
jgi:hypothetical protein